MRRERRTKSRRERTSARSSGEVSPASRMKDDPVAEGSVAEGLGEAASPGEPPPSEVQWPTAVERASGASARMPARRAFLVTAGKWTIGATGLVALGGIVRATMPVADTQSAAHYRIGSLADFRRGTTTALPDEHLFVRHDDGGLGVFSGLCTHLGCGLRAVPTGFACPCHGAHFDLDGHRESGPATRDLPWHRLWLEPDGTLWVDTGEAVEPGTTSLSALRAPRDDA